VQNALAHLLRDAAALSRSAGAADVMRCRQSPRASVEAAGEAVTHCMRACTRLRARGARRRAKYLSLERVQLSAHFFLACLMHRTCDAPERRPWPRAPGPALCSRAPSMFRTVTQRCTRLVRAATSPAARAAARRPAVRKSAAAASASAGLSAASVLASRAWGWGACQGPSLTGARWACSRPGPQRRMSGSQPGSPRSATCEQRGLTPAAPGLAVAPG